MEIYSLTFAVFGILSFAGGVSGLRHRTPVSILATAFLFGVSAFSMYWLWQSLTLW